MDEIRENEKGMSSIVAFLNKKNPDSNFSVNLLQQQLDQWENHAPPELIERNKRKLDENSFDLLSKEMKTNGLLLADVFEIIKNTPASEASAERGFTAVTRTVPRSRTSLSAETVAMQTRYASVLAATSTKFGGSADYFSLDFIFYY